MPGTARAHAGRRRIVAKIGNLSSLVAFALHRTLTFGHPASHLEWPPCARTPSLAVDCSLADPGTIGLPSENAPPPGRRGRGRLHGAVASEGRSIATRRGLAEDLPVLGLRL